MQFGRNAARRSRATAALLALALATAGCSGVGTDGASPPLAADAAAPTIDAATRTTPVVVGRPARVFIFAGLGDKCETIPPPEITVTQPPAKGDLNFKPGQETTIQYSAEGTCVGKTASGTGLYYTARGGAEGIDRFQVTAKLASGQSVTRSFEVQIGE